MVSEVQRAKALQEMILQCAYDSDHCLTTPSRATFGTDAPNALQGKHYAS